MLKPPTMPNPARAVHTVELLADDEVATEVDRRVSGL